MQYLIYPMKTVGFTQMENSSGSHKGILAIDMNGKDGGIESAYAPCDVIVLAKSSSANTVYFGSLDVVMCADNVLRKVTIAMTHDNYIGDIPLGKVFRTGEKFYDEGTKGGATGNHVHIEIAKGRVTNKVKKASGYYGFADSVALSPSKVFFALNGWNTVRSGYVPSSVKINWTNERETNTGGADMYQYIHTFQTQAIRKYPNTNNSTPVLARIPAGNTEANVLDWTERQSDKYQYVKVNYRGIVGYCQYDRLWFEVLTK